MTFLLYPNLADARALGAALPDEQRVDLVAAPIVSSALLVVTTVLATYKPWGRARQAVRVGSSRSAVGGATDA